MNSINNCGADAQTCYDNGVYSAACPYTICRYGIIDYITSKVSLIAYIILAFLLFQCLLLMFNFMLLCFSPRDSLERILNKSGALSPPSERQGNDDDSVYEEIVAI